MFGKIERDSLGNIRCDKCYKHTAFYHFKSSQEAKKFIDAPLCKRKLIHLCFACGKLFSVIAGGRKLR